MDVLEAERAEIEAVLSRIEELSPVAIHSGIAAIYARKMEALATTLTLTTRAPRRR